jgi:hypothetical protein
MNTIARQPPENTSQKTITPKAQGYSAKMKAMA